MANTWILPDSWCHPQDKHLICQMRVVQQLTADDGVSGQRVHEIQATE